MFHKEALDEAMPWDIRHPYLLDLATYAKAIERGYVFCDPSELACFRVSGTSWSSQILWNQPTDFLRWRSDWLLNASVPWSLTDATWSNVTLSARTLVRWVTFLGVSRLGWRSRDSSQ
jgi:hypothetical protein